MIAYFKRDDEDENEKENVNHKRGWKLFSIIPAIVSVIVFILTEDMTLPMVMTDKWTILMIVIALVQVVVCALSRSSKDDNENADGGQTQQA